MQFDFSVGQILIIDENTSKPIALHATEIVFLDSMPQLNRQIESHQISCLGMMIATRVNCSTTFSGALGSAACV
jgi:hypothetical protein